MEDGEIYTLWLEPRSNYAFPTRVSLLLRTDYGRDVAAVIGEQSV